MAIDQSMKCAIVAAAGGPEQLEIGLLQTSSFITALTPLCHWFRRGVRFFRGKY